MRRKITSLLVLFIVLSLGFSQAQTNWRVVKAKKTTITGNEVTIYNGQKIDGYSSTKLFPSQYQVLNYNFNFNPSNIWTGYNSQSNGTPQELWINTVTGELHAIVMYSAQTSGFSDRTEAYLTSTDGGVTWDSAGHVPPSSIKSGYGGISGFMSDGTALVAVHQVDATIGNNYKTFVYSDDAPGAGDFNTQLDPGGIPGASATYGPIWPRVTVINDNYFVVAASADGNVSGAPDSMYVNTYDNTSGNFTGWQHFPGDQAEEYRLAVSADSSIVGLLYVGNASYPGDLFYTQSTDNGITWAAPYQIWQTVLDTVIAGTPPDSIFLGVARGLDLVFDGNQPCATFGVVGMTPPNGIWTGWPSSIYFWRPDMNSSTPVVIADSNNVPFYNHYTYNDPNGVASLFPICRPNISRSQIGKSLFVSFLATTPYFYGDTTTGYAESYYAAYLTVSLDSGATWSTPIKFTPDSLNGHMQDFKFISMAPVNPVANDSVCTLHMWVQVDSIPREQVQDLPPGFPYSYATMYDINTDITIPIPLSVNQHLGNSPFAFNLQQNYPNPFNPTTKINYSLAKESNVVLKVYNILGQQVATLVNSKQRVGAHTINFDASKLASGVYIYKIQAGNFTQSKKMMLLK